MKVGDWLTDPVATMIMGRIGLFQITRIADKTADLRALTIYDKQFWFGSELHKNISMKKLEEEYDVIHPAAAQKAIKLLFDCKKFEWRDD
jgi:hypothetical protein